MTIDFFLMSPFYKQAVFVSTSQEERRNKNKKLNSISNLAPTKKFCQQTCHRLSLPCFHNASPPLAVVGIPVLESARAISNSI